MSTKNVEENRMAKPIAKVFIARKGIKLTKPRNPSFMYQEHLPKDDNDFNKLINEMMEWSDLETSVNINDFAISKRISPYRFKRLKNENFQEALELVKYKIASRNRQLVNDRECEKDIYFKELYMLDQDYRESEHEKIAKRVQGFKNESTTITVIDHMGDN
jgi:hypothetical protein